MHIVLQCSTLVNIGRLTVRHKLSIWSSQVNKFERHTDCTFSLSPWQQIACSTPFRTFNFERKSHKTQKISILQWKIYSCWLWKRFKPLYRYRASWGPCVTMCLPCVSRAVTFRSVPWLHFGRVMFCAHSFRFQWITYFLNSPLSNSCFQTHNKQKVLFNNLIEKSLIEI